MRIFQMFRPSVKTNIEEMKAKRDVKGLIKTLKRKDAGIFIREKAASALGEIGDVRAVKPLLRYALEQDWGVGPFGMRVATTAPSSLGKIGDVRAVKALLRLAVEKGRPVGPVAADTLVKIGKPAVEPLITAFLKAKDKNYKCKIAEILGGIGDTRSIEPLIAALEDKDSSVRDEAAYALKKLGASKAIPILKKKLLSGSIRANIIEFVFGCSSKDVITSILNSGVSTEEKKASITSIVRAISPSCIAVHFHDCGYPVVETWSSGRKGMIIELLDLYLVEGVTEYYRCHYCGRSIGTKFYSEEHFGIGKRNAHNGR